MTRLFDAAEDSGAILFFEQAAALSEKRNQVKDRLTNLKINYLLQRMEFQRGLIPSRD